MNLKIKIGSTRTAIVLPLEHAAIAVVLLQHGKLMKQEGYQADDPWVPHGENLEITSADDTPADPRLAALKKESEDNNARWYKAYTDNDKLTKELSTLRTAFETLKGQTVCRTIPAASQDEEVAF